MKGLVVFFGIMVLLSVSLTQGASYPEPFVGGNFYKPEETSIELSEEKDSFDEKDFQELYREARTQEVMDEVDRVNSEILNFCRVSNISYNCSKENIYDVYEGGSFSFSFEGKQSYLKVTKINSSNISFNYDSSKSLNLEGGNTHNLNSALSVELSQIKNKDGYLEVVKLHFKLSPQYLCEGYYIYDKCHAVGETFEMQNKTYYASNRSFEAKKDTGNLCEFDYECKNDSCDNGVCLSATIVELPEEKERKTSSIITGAVTGVGTTTGSLFHKAYCWLFRNANSCEDRNT